MSESPSFSAVTTSPQESSRNSKYTTETFVGNPQKWDQIGASVIEIFNHAFTDIITGYFGRNEGESYLKRDHHAIRRDFSNGDNFIVLLKENEEASVVGYAYVHPKVISYSTLAEEKKDAGNMGLSYQELVTQTSEVGWTIIKEEHRGQGGWSLMMDQLDAHLLREGKYTFMDRFVRDADQYSEKVKKRYSEKIICERSLTCPLGDQKYYRVRLK